MKAIKNLFTSSKEKAERKERARRVYTSYGIWNIMLRFITFEEAHFMQLTNRFQYEHAIGRV